MKDKPYDDRGTFYVLGLILAVVGIIGGFIGVPLQAVYFLCMPLLVILWTDIDRWFLSRHSSR